MRRRESVAARRQPSAAPGARVALRGRPAAAAGQPRRLAPTYRRRLHAARRAAYLANAASRCASSGRRRRRRRRRPHGRARLGGAPFPRLPRLSSPLPRGEVRGERVAEGARDSQGGAGEARRGKGVAEDHQRDRHHLWRRRSRFRWFRWQIDRVVRGVGGVDPTRGGSCPRTPPIETAATG